MKNELILLKYTLLVTVALLLSGTGSCQQAKTKSQVISMDPAVRTGKLANGFTYYIRKNQEPKNRVLLYLVNKVGSILEDEDQRGLAHFMEHMNFNGTQHFPHNELVNYLQKAGVRFGADINANTSFDETIYELPLPTDKPEIMEKGFEIIHDWTQFATLDPEEIDKERGVVLEEERLGKGASERMRRQYLPVLLDNSRYAFRVPIGVDKVLDNFKKPTLERFYKDWYRPDLQALIVVGDIDPDAIEKKIRKQFADLKNPLKEKQRPNYRIVLTGKNGFAAITDKEMTSTQMQVLMKFEQKPVRTEADYKRVVTESLFNQMITERFAELERESDPPFQDASAGIGSLIANLSSLSLNISSRPGQLERGLKTCWRTLAQLKDFGFTGTELTRAKKDYDANMQQALKEKDKIPSISFVNEYRALFLKGIPAPGIDQEVKLAERYLGSISVADENALIKLYLKNTDRDILILAPEKDKGILPGQAEVTGWMRTIEAEKLKPYLDQVSTLALLKTEPVAGTLVSEKEDDKLKTRTLILSNGVKVILKLTNFKNNEIQFSSFAPGGISVVDDKDYESAANAAPIIQSNGVGNYSISQLGKYLSGKAVSVSPYINDRYQGINGSSTTADLKTALQLVYAYFTEPRQDSDIFKNIIIRSKAALANRENDPVSVFSDSVTATLYNHNPRQSGPTMAKLMQIDPEESYRFYKERFSDATAFTFTFVGNINPDTIKPLLEKYLGGLPSTHQNKNYRDLDIHILSGDIEKTIYKGAADKATVIQVYSGDFDYNDANKVDMQALKECLEIRLLERLREDESGVYSPGVSVSVSKLPAARYKFVIQFGCAPQNVDKLVASSKDEINKLITQGPLQTNIDKWRAEDNASTETALKTNGFWLGYISSQMENGDDLGEIDHYSDLKAAVTRETLKNMAAKYLNGQNYVKMILMPEKK